jgi:hypothetical protein
VGPLAFIASQSRQELVSVGVRPKIIQAILRHSNVSITETCFIKHAELRCGGDGEICGEKGRLPSDTNRTLDRKQAQYANP